MKKIVYIDVDMYKRKYVREIIPDECTPIVDWYNEDFASRCIEAPENVQQNMIYNPETGIFSEWYPPENPENRCKTNEERIQDLETLASVFFN